MDIYKHSISKAKSEGFTLIELMISLVIMAILVSIAYPSFMQSIRKGNRSDAQSALTRTAGNLERFFATNGTYTVLLTDLGLDAGGASEQEHYVISVAAGATGIGSSYVITATAAAGDMQAHDTNCTVLSLDSLGAQLPDPVNSNCW